MSLLDDARDRVSHRFSTATDPRVTVGPRAVLVDCSHPDAGRLAGVAHRPAGEFDGEGSSMRELVDDGIDAPDGSVARAVGLAALNALSAPDIDWIPGDPMAALDAEVDTVATVGLFRPAFEKFDGVSVRVVERDASSIDEASLPADVPTTLFDPEDAPRAFDGVDVCFVTGSSFVYGGIEAYLDAARDVPLVVVIGATASFAPELLFERGVHLVAGAQVRDVAAVRAGIRAGDCGTDLHDAGLRKVYCAATTTLPGVQLPPQDTNSRP